MLKVACDVSALSASSPVKTTPPESAEPQEDSAEPSSSSQESLPATDAPAPQPDPDAWIQVEKRHRQPPGKPKVVNNRRGEIQLEVLTSFTASHFHFHPFFFLFLITFFIFSCPPSSILSSCLPPCLCPTPFSAGSMSVMMCVLSALLLPQHSNPTTSPLQLSTSCSRSLISSGSARRFSFILCLLFTPSPRSSSFSHAAFSSNIIYLRSPNIQKITFIQINHY